MFWVCSVAQQHLGHLTHGNRASGEGLLRDDSDKRSLGQRGGGPTVPRMLPKPSEHVRMVFVRRPAKGDERIGVEQVRQADSSSMRCT